MASTHHEPLGSVVADLVRCDSLLDMLAPGVGTEALRDVDGLSPPLTHAALHTFLSSTFPQQLQAAGVASLGGRIGVCIPNGAHAATALLAAMTYGTAVPCNPQGTVAEVVAELTELKCTLCLLLAGADDHTSRAGYAPVAFGLADALTAAGVEVLHVQPDWAAGAGLFTLAGAHTRVVPLDYAPPPRLTQRDEHALLLRTSGSTGRRKVVPFTVEQLEISARCCATPWCMTAKDVTLSCMPLFHAGGIIRVLMAPLVTGGCVVFAPGFDVSSFWRSLLHHRVTWFYGAPTLHGAIVAHAKAHPEVTHGHVVRLIGNAAGPLLPSAAWDLQAVFGPQTAVLPCYGMTECMPISSPSVTYRLERPGTSGLACGPELTIRDPHTGAALPALAPGAICVRGPPVFPGYLPDDGSAVPVPPAFLGGDGWFDTGDVGHLDADGYLFITGRSKEVINRGGEIISPVEVEEALATHPAVAAVAAFSAPHAQLQEVVGILLVTRPGHTRLCLRDLHSHAAASLHPFKWPQVLVHCAESLPVSHTNKVQRLHAAQRLGLPTLDGSSSHAGRTFQCFPVRGADISATIRCEPCVDADDADPSSVGSEPHGAEDPHVSALCVYLQATMASVLGLDNANAIGRDDSFFECGGTSLRAGQLLGTLRSRFPEVTSLNAGTIYAAPTPKLLAVSLRRCGARWADASADATGDSSCAASGYLMDALPHSNTSPAALFLQLLPLVLFQPLLRAAKWLTFAALLASSILPSPVPSGVTIVNPWLTALVATVDVAMAAALTTCVLQLAVPWLGILAKWLLIGRFRERDCVPIWSSLYLRWWLASQIRSLAGMGVFGCHSRLIVLYYRLLGARIGRNVFIHRHAQLGEYDLLELQDGAFIGAKVTLRPFQLLSGAFRLARITVGADATVASQSIVSPGATLPAKAYIRPCSSDAAMELDVSPRDARAHLRDAAPAPHPALLALVAAPLYLTVALGARLVQFLILYGMVVQTGFVLRDRPMREILLWFATPKRFLWYTLNKVARETVVPFIEFGLSLLIKRAFGPLQPGPRTHSQRERLHDWMLDALFGHGLVARCSALVGANFEGTSVLMRALGARVGTGVFHSGSGMGTLDWDLISIGDHCVFGSRSTVAASGAEERRRVTFGNGCMLADRCCVQPGASLGVCTVAGSGTLVPAGTHLADGAVFMGTSLDGTSAPRLWSASAYTNKEDTSTPYSRAMLNRRGAPYWVIPCWAHTVFNLLTAATVAAFWCIPLLGALLLCVDTQKRLHVECALFVLTFCGLHSACCLVALGIDVGAHRVLLGRRTAGNYDWDVSSFCQRWVLMKRIAQIRAEICQHLGGSAYIVWFLRMHGASIGPNVCLYPNGADPIATEPDLLSLGDNVCVDNASLTAHTNTRGTFGIQPLRVGACSVLRSHTRLMGGAALGKHCTLLEHTLVVSGDDLPAGTTWLGWPASGVAPVASKMPYVPLDEALLAEAPAHAEDATWGEDLERPGNEEEDLARTLLPPRRRRNRLSGLVVALFGMPRPASGMQHEPQMAVVTRAPAHTGGMAPAQLSDPTVCAALGFANGDLSGYQRRLWIGTNTTAPFLPVYSTHPLGEDSDDAVQSAVVILHGLGGNANDYFCTGAASTPPDIMVIAPWFGSQQVAAADWGGSDGAAAASLFWGNTTRWTSGGDAVASGDETVAKEEATAFGALDTLLAVLREKCGMRSISVVGMSAGAQLALRHAFASGHEDEPGIGPHVKYLVASPGSYLYLDGARPASWCRPFNDTDGFIAAECDAFEVPSLDEVQQCDAYNDYKLGLGAGLATSNAYLAPMANNPSLVEAAIQRFLRRDMLIVVGAEDACNCNAAGVVNPDNCFWQPGTSCTPILANDSSLTGCCDTYPDSRTNNALDTSCGAMMQGAARLHRGLLYGAYLRSRFQGSPISWRGVHVVSHMGHDVQALMQSRVFKRFAFGGMRGDYVITDNEIPLAAVM